MINHKTNLLEKQYNTIYRYIYILYNKQSMKNKVSTIDADDNNVKNKKKKTSKVKDIMPVIIIEDEDSILEEHNNTSIIITTETETTTATDEPNILNSSFDMLKHYYDACLNLDKTTYKSSNDEPTPIDCIIEMMQTIPSTFWNKNNLSILDPCCGNGNFAVVILDILLRHNNHSREKCLNEIIHFNDINEDRLKNVRDVFCADRFHLNITSEDFLISNSLVKHDLIVANPPYAKMLENGKRASKNHNLIKDFIDKSLSMLKPNGLLLFITPDNWMSFADRNTLIETITQLQILRLDIHSAKKYFKKIGSSFTWYLIENCPSYKNIEVSGMWKKKPYHGLVQSKQRKYIPLLYNQLVQNILMKTVDNEALVKFKIETSSDLHRYTKRDLIADEANEIFKHKLIHTPSQTVFSSRPHKFQDGYKVFISTTDKYQVFIDMCGMTQSIVFIRCQSEAIAKRYQQILQHPLYLFINNICRWGNFNNIRILQSFPMPEVENISEEGIYNYFNITQEEKIFIQEML